VTGGGGSIGSELARQVAAFEPASLTLVDHDETHLFDAVAGVSGPVRQRLADIRDVDALAKVFDAEQPEVVFHAAALKHVPILEEHPVQAVHTNVLGTRNVVECAERVGVERFVFISTDKAVRPSSVMGTTKLAGEHLVLGRSSAMTACAVRFGNVLGSRGSVVPTFVRQIREGGPVTVTDARMTRYFMSIPEAVRLVLHAAALSRGREIFMLDMGEPVRIIDLARRMIQLSGQRPGTDVEIRVTAIRPGEKLAEELHAPDEVQHPTGHPSIVRLDPVRVAAPLLQSVVSRAEHAAATQDGHAAREALQLVLGARHQVAVPETPDVATVERQEVAAWS
jgi:O-antigen biosynthesis protein WbqV